MPISGRHRHRHRRPSQSQHSKQPTQAGGGKNDGDNQWSLFLQSMVGLFNEYKETIIPFFFFLFVVCIGGIFYGTSKSDHLPLRVQPPKIGAEGKHSNDESAKILSGYMNVINTFKTDTSLNMRKEQSKAMAHKYPTVYFNYDEEWNPVKMQHDHGSVTIATILKNLSVDQTFGVIALLENGHILPKTAEIGTIFEQHKDEDGFLYLIYSDDYGCI